MSAQVAEAGKNQGLLVDGGRADQEPRTAQTTRRETRGKVLSFHVRTWFAICDVSRFEVEKTTNDSVGPFPAPLHLPFSSPLCHCFLPL